MMASQRSLGAYFWASQWYGATERKRRGLTESGVELISRAEERIVRTAVDLAVRVDPPQEVCSAEARILWTHQQSGLSSQWVGWWSAGLSKLRHND